MQEDSVDGVRPSDDAGERSESDAVLSAESRAQESETSTALVEVAPGVALVLGEVPDGLQLVDFGLISAFDRNQLSLAMGTIGNLGSVAGNLAEAALSVQGLYRVNDATLQMLKGGAELAAKDGAKLGAMFQGGKMVGQARFIPMTLSAGAIAAAIGPAIAMMAVQMQLNEVSGLVKANIALTSQTLKSIRHDQWSELTGLVGAIDRAVNEATKVQAVTSTIWESISGSGAIVEKQLDQYRLNVNEHIRQLRLTSGSERRRYLETNAEAMLFDANGLLLSLKAHTGYQALRVSRARDHGVEHEVEARLAKEISERAQSEFDSAIVEIRELVNGLTRELRIIAELPGRATLPLSKKRREAHASQLTCEQLLSAIQPLAEALEVTVAELVRPEIVCAPEDVDLDAYLQVLRWHIESGDSLKAIAFPYSPGSHNFVGKVPAVLGKRIDAAWEALEAGKRAAVIDKLAAPTVVAVTDRKILLASSRSFLTQGLVDDSISLNDVKFVRHPGKQLHSVRDTITVTTEQRDYQWMFPAMADTEQIDKVASVIEAGAARPKHTQAAIDGPESLDAMGHEAELASVEV